MLERYAFHFPATLTAGPPRPNIIYMATQQTESRTWRLRMSAFEKDFTEDGWDAGGAFACVRRVPNPNKRLKKFMAIRVT